MGWRYFIFRTVYELKLKTGWLKKSYPTGPPVRKFISLNNWKKLPVRFFFENKEQLAFPEIDLQKLKTEYERFQSGQLYYFNSVWLDRTDWLTNPDTSYRYDPNLHWTEVDDFSATAGDIKFVWEQSRFSWVLTLIRYDFHFKTDCAATVFGHIDDWIAKNPVNQGPNYKCSQEISLRILNWLFALYYYRHNEQLSEARFQRIMHVVYWQLKHVYANINFSRIAVRNNHAITETLMLYLAGLFFPFFPEAAKWKKNGKKWLEEEINYQIYDDGTYLQFSHNYHRVVIQLLTWAFYLSELNGERFDPAVYEKTKKSLIFLYQCQDLKTGLLPNFGANDGALFFKLNNCSYRNYKPQLGALHYYFTREKLYPPGSWEEDIYWYCGNKKWKTNNSFLLNKKCISHYPEGGHFIINENNLSTQIRCASFKDRPSHADNLHIDIWYNGENIMRDAGTYKYNTEEKWVTYFNGTKSHNTVMLGKFDQMQKGPRFIWLNWSEAIKSSLEEFPDYYLFRGSVRAFQQVSKGVIHHREVKKEKSKNQWTITDFVEHDTDLPLHQIWNISDQFRQYFSISSIDEAGNLLTPHYTEAWYSSFYGKKEKCQAIIFTTVNNKLITTISPAN